MHVQRAIDFLVKQNLNVYQMDHGVTMSRDVVSSTDFVSLSVPYITYLYQNYRMFMRDNDSAFVQSPNIKRFNLALGQILIMSSNMLCTRMCACIKYSLK